MCSFLIEVFYQAIRICNEYISNHAVKDNILDKIIQIRMSQIKHLSGSDDLIRYVATYGMIQYVFISHSLRLVKHKIRIYKSELSSNPVRRNFYPHM